MNYYGLIMPSVFPTGVFIQDIKQTESSSESEGVNTLTVTLTNQQKAYFHIKNGQQGSIAEATAQMEQHAKDYISAELQEQKTALEQAIEIGKSDINEGITQASTELTAVVQSKEADLQGKVDEAKNYINSQLSAASDETQQNIATKIEQAKQELTQSITAEVLASVEGAVNGSFIKLFTNCIYVQRWGDPRPQEVWTFEGYEWREIDRQGVYERPRGSGATFKAIIDGQEQTLTAGGSDEFDGKIHGDRIRNIEGTVKGTGLYGEGVFSKSVRVSKGPGGYDWEIYKSNFDASRVVPTGNENTPIYQVVVHWKLFKI